MKACVEVFGLWFIAEGVIINSRTCGSGLFLISSVFGNSLISWAEILSADGGFDIPAELQVNSSKNIELEMAFEVSQACHLAQEA